MKQKEEHIFPVRFPRAVWEQLVQLAQAEERSLNWEVVQAVRERIARHQKGDNPREKSV